MSETGLRIRVEDALRLQFLSACKARDTTAAQVLRAYMRSYIVDHGSPLQQPDLFDRKEPGEAPLDSRGMK